MYAFRASNQDAIDDLTCDLYDPEEFFYWRKHHDLHGYMEKLYHEKGGLDVFNGRTVRLTIHDLTCLRETIRKRELPRTTGFFFGNNPPNDESDKKDYEFIDKAMQAIEEGDSIYYCSSW